MSARRRPAADRFIALLVLAAACGEAAPPPSAATVSIATAAEYAAMPSLALEDVRSACGDGAPCSKLFYPMAIVLPGGDIAWWGVAERRPQLYRTRGDSVLALGRSGGGPGEYRMPLALGVTSDDEVLAADLMQRRILRYGADGASRAMPAIALPPRTFDLVFVAGELRAFANSTDGRAGDSLPVQVFALDADASRPRELYTLPFRTPAFAMEDMRPMPRPFAAQTLLDFGADGRLVGTAGSEFTIDEFGADGAHTTRFGFTLEPRAVTGVELDSARERAVRRVPDRRMREALDREMRTGATIHPAITRLAALEDGSIWVRESPSELADSVRWIVYAAAAQVRGAVRLAIDDRVHGARDGLVLVSREGDESRPEALRWMRVVDPR